jgi:hypothetical protein
VDEEPEDPMRDLDLMERGRTARLSRADRREWSAAWLRWEEDVLTLAEPAVLPFGPAGADAFARGPRRVVHRATR